MEEALRQMRNGGKNDRYKRGSWGSLFLVQIGTPRKTNECPLKRDYFNRKCIFEPSFFSGYVSFQGGNVLLNPMKPEITELSKQCCHEGIDGPRCPNMTDLEVHKGITGKSERDCHEWLPPPQSLTARPWKMVLGRRSFPIGEVTFRGELFNFGEASHFEWVFRKRLRAARPLFVWCRSVASLNRAALGYLELWTKHEPLHTAHWHFVKYRKSIAIQELQKKNWISRLLCDTCW